MVDENTENQETEDSTTTDEATVESDQQQADKDLVEKLVKQRVDEALKPIKSSLDKAYSARDEALRKAAELEQRQKDAERQRMIDEGKHKEVLEMQLAEEKAARLAIEKKNIELTRDIDVKNSLGSFEFRNENAREMAYREITANLVRNADGQWIHRSGVSIRDYTKAFVESEENAFLLKPKVSSGAGNSSLSTSTGSRSKDNISLFDRPQEEVLQMIREGKLPRKT